MDERMTICNMSIEGGARVGYVNPDQTTFDYLRGRRFAPQGDDFERAAAWWAQHGVRSGRALRRRGAIDAGGDPADGDLGHQSGPVGLRRRAAAAAVDADPATRESLTEALEFMGFRGGEPIKGTRIDVAFVGSCTNARLSDLREAARIVRGQHVAPHVKALVVPGSQARAGGGRARRAGPRVHSTPASSGAAPAARCAWR